MSEPVVYIPIPRKLVEELEKRGLDPEEYIIELLLRELNLDPEESAKIHVELAVKFLNEGRKLIDSDSVQACEKLYKAAEECVKALTVYLNLKDILEKVRNRGRWTVTELEKAVEAISDRVGTWFQDAWDSAWVLHVWGFHEAKSDSEAVRRRLPHIERIVQETCKLVTGESFLT